MPAVNRRGDIHGEAAEGEPMPSPRHRLRARRLYWAEMMHRIGLVCMHTLSVISGGFLMDSDPAKGPATPIHLHHHPSALAEAAFVSWVSSASSGTGGTSTHLRKRPFLMETLQREGRALFERSTN